MKTILYILSGFLLISEVTSAQDIHFSATDYSPLTLNPAMAGANYGLQATVNYRNQWNAVATPYQTVAAGVDLRIGKEKRNKNGSLALGLNFYNDNTGENRISSNKLGLTIAYQLKINDENSLGLGLQGNYGQRAIEVSNGKWGNQYDGQAYNSSLSTGEAFGSPSFSYFDANAGMVYTYRPRQTSRNNNGTLLNIGLSANHINQPSFSFIKNDGEDLYVRWSAFAMAKIGIGNKRMAIEPQLIAKFQGPSLETLLGTDYRFFLGQGTSSSGYYDGTSLAVGLFWRNQDALISRLSVRFGGIDAGVVYDFNLFNNLKEVSRAKGGVEVFLRYILNKNPFNTTRARI